MDINSLATPSWCAHVLLLCFLGGKHYSALCVQEWISCVSNEERVGNRLPLKLRPEAIMTDHDDAAILGLNLAFNSMSAQQYHDEIRSWQAPA
jgi:hypothetical protein